MTIINTEYDNLPTTSTITGSWRKLAWLSTACGRNEIPYHLAIELKVLPLGVCNKEKNAKLHLCIPKNINEHLLLDQLKLITGMQTHLIRVESDVLKKAIPAAYTPHASVISNTHKDNHGKDELNKNQADKHTPERIDKVNVLKVGKTRTSNMLRYILLSAFQREASDIHITLKANSIPKVFFRENGNLNQQEVQTQNNTIGMDLLRHIKVICSLDLTEHTRPQDGAFLFTLNDQRVRCRVSIVPLLEGAKIAIRILHHYLLDESDLNGFDLMALGMLPAQSILFSKFMDARSIKSPGLCLISGTTGSGKSTVLYSLLEKCTEEKNIISIEDPIEREIENITQIAVDQSNNDFYLETFKAVLRQDPDIVVLAEIRDFRILEIAIQAALSGITVLSTIHANSIYELILRLFELGGHPISLGSVLKLCSHQILVPRVCQSCSPSLLSNSNTNIEIEQTCYQCKGAGTSGRIAVFETLAPSSELINEVYKKFRGNGKKEPRTIQNEYYQKYYPHYISHRQAARELNVKGLIPNWVENTL